MGYLYSQKLMTSTKPYYKIGEVSEMLGVTIPTLRYWESEFEQLEPFRTPGGMRKYRPEDVEMCKLIKHLLRDKGYSLEYANKKLTEFYATGQLNVEEQAFACKSAKDALRLLSELKIKCEGDSYAVARIEALAEWIAGTISNIFL